jgi:hypothetical protein
MNDFVSLVAGTVSPVELFDPGYIRHMLSAPLAS